MLVVTDKPNADVVEPIYTEIDEFPFSKCNNINFSSEISETNKSQNYMNVEYVYDIPQCMPPPKTSNIIFKTNICESQERKE